MPKYNYKKAFFGKRNKRRALKTYRSALTTAIRVSPYSKQLSFARKGINYLASKRRRW